MDQEDLFNAFEEGIEQTIKEKIRKGIVLTPTEKEILEGKLAIYEGDFVEQDGAKKSTAEIINKTIKSQRAPAAGGGKKKRAQAGGMQTGFTLDWTGVYKPILTVFNGGKRKTRKSKKTRKGKGKKGRKGTRRH